MCLSREAQHWVILPFIFLIMHSQTFGLILFDDSDNFSFQQWNRRRFFVVNSRFNKSLQKE